MKDNFDHMESRFLDPDVKNPYEPAIKEELENDEFEDRDTGKCHEHKRRTHEKRFK